MSAGGTRGEGRREEGEKKGRREDGKEGKKEGQGARKKG